MALKMALGVVLAFAVSMAVARPVTPEEAVRVVNAWGVKNVAFTERSPEAQTPVAVMDDGGNLLYYKVMLGEKGLVIVAGDTAIEPIIAVIPEAESVEIPVKHTLHTLLLKDMTARREVLVDVGVRTLSEDSSVDAVRGAAEARWEALLNPGLTTLSLNDNGNPGHIYAWPECWRTGQLAHWSQYAGNRYVAMDDGTAYDRYTPVQGDGWPTLVGCVATAAAALLEYYQVPAGPQGVVNTCSVEGVGNKRLRTIGGRYDWSLLPTWEPNVTVSEEARELLGRVGYDLGVLVGMSYGFYASGAYTENLVAVCREHYGFQEMTFVGAGFLEETVYAQARCGAPVLLVVAHNESGKGSHLIHVVGYGEDDAGTKYSRLFMGWGGNGDGWYALPMIESEQTFTVVTHGVTAIGYDDDKVVALYGRVLDAEGKGVANATVTITDNNGEVTTLSTGEYGEYGIRVSKALTSATLAVEGYEPQNVNLEMTKFPAAVNFSPSVKPIPFHTNLAEAHAEALREGKLLFTMSGRDLDLTTHTIRQELAEIPAETAEQFVYYFYNLDGDSPDEMDVGSMVGQTDGYYAMFDTYGFDLAKGKENMENYSIRLGEMEDGVALATAMEEAIAAFSLPSAPTIAIEGAPSIYYGAKYRVKLDERATLPDECLTWSTSTAGASVSADGILLRGEATEEITLTVTATLKSGDVSTTFTVTPSNDPMVNLSVAGTTVNGAGTYEEVAYFIPEGMTGIASGAFVNTTDVREIHIPTSLTTIGTRAFTLKPIKPVLAEGQLTFSVHEGTIFNKDMTTLLYAAYGLTSYTVPSRVTTIAAGAFEKHPTLREVVLPKSVATVNERAFSQCPKLERLTVEPGSQLEFGLASVQQCVALTEVNLGDGVKAIGEKAFWNCPRLRTITIPGTVKTIGQFAFQYCYFTSLVLEDGVERIEEGAFQGSWLRELTLPRSLRYLGSNAFEGVTMNRVTFLGALPEVGEVAPFGNTASNLENHGGRGYYLSSYASEWEPKFTTGTVGKLWSNLAMTPVAVSLPEGIANEETQEWLAREIVDATFATNLAITLAENTTAKDVEGMRLLGISPYLVEQGLHYTSPLSTLTTTSDATPLTLSGKVALQVEEMVVEGAKLTLVVKICASEGALLPEGYQPPVAPKIYGYTELGGTPVVLAATNPEKWTRLSSTEAEQTIEAPIGESCFFRVIAGEE